jgi:hypothetical protein
LFHEIELLTLAGGVWGLCFIFWKRITLKLIPNSYMIIAAYSCYLLAWVCTVTESFMLENLFNYGEHILYAIGSILLCIWCYRSLSRQGA